MKLIQFSHNVFINIDISTIYYLDIVHKKNIIITEIRTINWLLLARYCYLLFI